MIPPDAPVSARSVYGDPIWDFAVELAPRRTEEPRKLSFAMRLADGTSLLDPVNAALLEDAKRLCFFLLREDPSRPRCPSTVVQLRRPFKWLFGELARRGHRSLAPFCLDVSEEITRATILRRRNAAACVRLFIQLWRHCEALAHPPLRPPAPELIERWRRAAGSSRPTAPLEPEEALMLGGFALSIVRRAGAALDGLRKPTPERFRKALMRAHSALELRDVLTAIHAVVLLEACLRPLELVTLPMDCIVKKDGGGTEPRFTLHGTRWKRREALAGSPATWTASRHVVISVSLLRELALLHRQETLVFAEAETGRLHPATTKDVYRGLRAFAEKWDLKSLSRERLRINPRRLRATGSMLLVRYEDADDRTLRRELQHGPRSRVTESRYGHLAPMDLARLCERAPMPFHEKYGVPGIGA